MTKQIIVLSGTHRIGSVGWRHLLTWRQLSILWQVPISTRLMGQGSAPENDPGCYSMVTCDWEDGPYIAEQRCQIDSPMVVFVIGKNLDIDAAARSLVSWRQLSDKQQNKIQHVFRVETRNPLGRGSPERVTIYGSCPRVTPLNVRAGMDIVVSLNDIPVIVAHGRCLLIGADPWQFGTPSVPMLYKVLSNWLVREAGINVRMIKPYAAIRLDDLPATAEHFRINAASNKAPDRARANAINHLRGFAKRTGAKFTLMYSSHAPTDNVFTPVSELMPRSIRQMQRGVKDGVFEIGSHGLVHLRNPKDSKDVDPREFLDLEAEETAAHLNACDREIMRLFGIRAMSFVAPAWGYRPGVTKEVAKRRYSALIDSSQNVEAGKSDLLFSPVEGALCLNIVETFRASGQVLAYSSPEFWKCYAAAGIPVHYMQHSPTNWHLLRNILRRATCASSRTQNLRSKLMACTDDFGKPAYLRLISAVFLALIVACEDSSSRRLLCRVLMHSSLYAIVRAIMAGGYRCITVNQLAAIGNEYTSAHDATVDAVPGREADCMSA